MTRGDARGLYYAFSAGRVRVERGIWRPNTDISETETHVIVSLEVAGVSAEDIAVVQYPDRLVIRGVRQARQEPGARHYHQIEIVCGEFEKEILLSDPLRGAEVEAELCLGVLSVRIMKCSAAGRTVRRTIPIEAH